MFLKLKNKSHHFGGKHTVGANLALHFIPTPKTLKISLAEKLHPFLYNSKHGHLIATEHKEIYFNDTISRKRTSKMDCLHAPKSETVEEHLFFSLL